MPCFFPFNLFPFRVVGVLTRAGLGALVSLWFVSTRPRSGGFGATLTPDRSTKSVHTPPTVFGGDRFFKGGKTQKNGSRRHRGSSATSQGKYRGEGEQEVRPRTGTSLFYFFVSFFSFNKILNVSFQLFIQLKRYTI